MLIPAIFVCLITFAESYYRSKEHNGPKTELNIKLYEELRSVQSVDSMFAYIDSLRQGKQPDEYFDNTISFHDHEYCSYFLRLICNLTGYDTLYYCWSPQYTRFYPFQLDSVFDWYRRNRDYIDVDSLRYLLHVQDVQFWPPLGRFVQKGYMSNFLHNNFPDETSRNRMFDLLWSTDSWLELSKSDSLFLDSVLKQFPQEELLLDRLKMDYNERIYESMRGKWRDLREKNACTIHPISQK